MSLRPFSLRAKRSGFTLIELLLVIAIIAILAAIVIIAINPARQLAQANNAQRRSDVNTVLNAVGQYAVDNRGAYPATITSASQQVCRTGASCTVGLDLSVLTNNELYLTAMPIDPTGSSATGTGYYVAVTTSTNPRIVVNAPSAELGTVISVSR